MRSLSSVLIIALTTIALGCQDSTSKPGGEGASSKTPSTAEMPVAGEGIATVNGVPIGSDEYKEAASRKKPAEGNTLSAEERKEIIDRLVEEKLLYKAALEKGLDKDPKVQKVMVNTLLRDEVYNDIRSQEISEEELQKYFEVHKEDFVVPEKVQIKRILIKVEGRTDDEAKAEAERLHKILKADTGKFKEVAAKNSEDPYRRRGGDVGFVARTGKPGFDQAVVDKAFEMNVEQLSAPFKSESGWNIIFVANKRERVERTFQQMKGSVLRKVKNERLKELYESYVAGLKTGAKVDIDEAKLSSLTVDRGGAGGKAKAKAKSGGMKLTAPPAAPEGPAGGEAGQ
jgi:parvulin-like peptidyl-prolyl isomerase